MKKIIVDLDDTLCRTVAGDYENSAPVESMVARLREYKEQGFLITIHTSRNMRTYQGNIGKINVHTLPTILGWLDRHAVPYDEVVVGKPWCGTDGFYIDDRAIRPSEFLSHTYEELVALLEKER